MQNMCVDIHRRRDDQGGGISHYGGASDRCCDCGAVFIFVYKSVQRPFRLVQNFKNAVKYFKIEICCV